MKRGNLQVTGNIPLSLIKINAGFLKLWREMAKIWKYGLNGLDLESRDPKINKDHLKVAEILLSLS